MVKVSDELCATVKSISGLYAALYKFDANVMLNLIWKAIFNFQSQQYFPTAVHMIKRSFYYRRQDKGSTVQKYYENLKRIWK